MDINICIDRLGLNNNQYKLNRSNPPHHFTEWSGNDPQPTEAELQAAWDAYVSEEAAIQYQRDRADEYPSIDELVVALWEGVVEERMAAVTQLETLRKAVKAKYPKG
jgi:hypothetical protein